MSAVTRETTREARRMRRTLFIVAASISLVLVVVASAGTLFLGSDEASMLARLGFVDLFEA
ncbi:MAG: hypothetical protein RR672_04210, partial [Raoultibacter sp.]